MTTPSVDFSAVFEEVRQEEIRRRAYRIYLESGKIEGRDTQNWLQAEAEHKARMAKAAAAGTWSIQGHPW